MKKITVTFYLDSRLKPTTIENNKKGKLELYPIYVKIIYDKNAIYIRSRTWIEATANSFEQYLITNTFIEDETFGFIGYTLKMEYLDIYNSIKLIDEFKIKTNRKTLLVGISKLTQSAYYSLLKTLQERYIIETAMLTGEEKKYFDFIFSFNIIKNLLEDIAKIEDFAKVDLLPLIKDNDVLKWETLKLVKDLYPIEMTFANFYYSGFTAKINAANSKNTVENFEKILEVLKDLINYFIESVQNDIKEY